YAAYQIAEQTSLRVKMVESAAEMISVSVPKPRVAILGARAIYELLIRSDPMPQLGGGKSCGSQARGWRNRRSRERCPRSTLTLRQKIEHCASASAPLLPDRRSALSGSRRPAQA